ncbi:acyltransferase family protein [Methylobacterium mesophilicum]
MKRFEMLDLLRGWASIAVVAFHLGTVKLSPGLVSHGYLAVDLFFLLSGFVIFHAYEPVLVRGLPFSSFMVSRVVRLYPLAFLGAALGFFVLILKFLLYPEKVDDIFRILISGFMNLLILPSPFSGAGARYELFPTNGPLWSLFAELLINFTWALWGFKARSTIIVGVIVVSAALMVVSAKFNSTLNIGFDIMTAFGGVSRICFGFYLGIILYKVKFFLPRLHSKAWPVLILVILSVVFVGPPDGLNISRVWWDCTSAIVVLPIIVLTASLVRPIGRLSQFSGDVSYPVYALHFPVLLLVSGLHQGNLPGTKNWVLCVGSLVLVICIGLCAANLYDIPARRFLRRLAARWVPGYGAY